MSIAYTSTSFGAAPSSSRNHSGSARHQRHASGSSASSPVVVDDLPGLPPPATARSPTHVSDSERMMRAQYDQMGAFFGAQPSSGRSQPRSSSSSHGGHARNASTGRTPPPYDSRSELESLPTYSKVEEYDAKLNRKLFIYGFRTSSLFHITSPTTILTRATTTVFFPLWIVGIIAPFVTPMPDPTKDNRSKEDQEADYANMRKVEMRWALRCGIALLSFVTIVAVAVAVGVTVASHH